MKKLFLTLVALMPLFAMAQVKFVNTNFAEAQKMAQKAGKELLVDVARGTVAEPKINEVFKDKELAKFINKNFLAVRIDMSAPENKDFGQYLYSLMYPCVVFYSARGEQLESTNWHSVATKTKNLKELAQKSLDMAAVKRANVRSINFRDLDYKQALEVAKKEGKLLFVDNYTTWCRPCKQMEMDVFTLNSVADYYNENFVSIKLDADKDPYKVAKNNGVRGFPGYLYFDADGGLILSEGGFNPEQKFIGFGQNALQIYNDNKEINLQKIDLDEAKAQAKKDGKMIFVDLSATWCGPCKALKATVFKSPVVARLHNAKFVNMYVECDVQKELAEKMKNLYGYSAFPTMLYLNADGELIHKYVGAGMSNEEFLAVAKVALENKGLKHYNDRYAAGEKTPQFIKEYIGVLATAYQKETAAKVTTDYLNSLTVDELATKENYEVMKENVKDLDAKPIQLFLANKDKFKDIAKRRDIDNFELMLWAIKSRSFVSRGENPTLDKSGYSAFLKRLKASGLPKEVQSDLVADAKLSNAENLNDWKSYVAMTTASMKKAGAKFSMGTVYNQGLRVEQRCKDNALRLKFATALENALAAYTKAGGQSSMGGAYEKAIGDVVAKLKAK